MVMLLTPLHSPFSAGADWISREQQESLSFLTPFWKEQLEDLAGRIPAEAVADEIAKRRTTFMRLMGTATSSFFSAASWDPTHLFSLLVDEADRLSLWFQMEGEKVLPADSLQMLRSTMDSYMALLVRLAREVTETGPQEATTRMLMEASDDLTDFPVAIAALQGSFAKEFACEQRNVETLIRIADNAVGHIEERFLIATLAEDASPEGELMGFEESLKGDGYSVFLEPRAQDDERRLHYHPAQLHLKARKALQEIQQDPTKNGARRYPGRLFCRLAAGLRIVYEIDEDARTVTVRGMVQREEAFKMPKA